MAKQAKVLRAIAEARKPITISGICVALKLNAADRKNRKGVIKAVGGLISRGLVIRQRPKQEGFDPPMPKYEVAKAGRDLLRDGGKIDSGPRGKFTGAPAVKTTTLRARVWKAFRQTQSRKATVPELVELALQEGEDAEKAFDNTHRYLKALMRAGIVSELACRAKGDRPGSNGFKRYFLLNDVGPLAPVPCAKNVFDPNANERIPFAAAKTSEAA